MFNKIKDYFCRNEDFMSGHIDIGNLIIYGRNAMHWGVCIRTKKYGYICFRLPLPCFGRWYPLYFYCSPNATPWAATFMLGRKHSKDNWCKSRIRYSCLGHNFEVDGWNEEYGCTNYDILRGINRMIDSGSYIYQQYQKEHPDD